MTETRPELEKPPRRIRKLPVDERGYPVPWFVAWHDGKPEFRAMDREKFTSAIRDKRCWVCGENLGRFMTFVIGPMCGINRVSSEPPSHHECAQWSARNCPFLSRPHMVHRENDLPDDIECPAGFSIDRNPGVTLLWTTTRYVPFDDGTGKLLIRVGEPADVEWWSEGRRATRAEVEHSVETGLPSLQNIAKLQRGAMEELSRAHEWLKGLYPVT